MMLKESLFLFIALVVCLTTATKVKDCKTHRYRPDTTQVQISGCNSPPCKLKKNTVVGVEQRFTPDHDIQTLTTGVKAGVLGIDVPFVGVDGASACDKIFNLDGTPAPCPLKGGVEYVYKNQFFIEKFYPQLNVIVTWSLREKRKPVTCFEVAASITA